jgi:hypothetical protein
MRLNKFGAILLALSSIPCAYITGAVGELIGKSLASHFDSRAHSLLGINAAHYIWLLFPLNLIIIQTVWNIAYASEWLKLSMATGFSMKSLIPDIFLLGIFGTLWLTAKGVSNAYRILAGFENISTTKARVWNILKFGFGLPMVAALLQTGIRLLHLALVRIFD